MSDLDSQWIDIPGDRMERFEEMFRWNEDTSHYYDDAQLGPGLDVLDVGCGPGHQAVEFARRTSPGGHIHAVDVNDEFLASARRKADEAGIPGRITTHLVADEILPMPAGSVDRVIVRNTLIHVPRPEANLTEFRRVLRADGLLHIIEGDRRLMALEPIALSDWSDLIDAAAWAWKQPVIGRQLHRLARGAGFSDIRVRVVTAADMTGRLLGMIRTIGEYAITGGMSRRRVEAILDSLDRAVSQGTYLAVSPQFIVTASPQA